MDETVQDRIERLLEAERPAFLRLKTYSGAYTTRSYSAVVRRALRWAAYLRDAGLKPADRIGIVLPHGLDAYTSYLGAVLAGCVPSFLHFPSPKLSYEPYSQQIAPIFAEAKLQRILTVHDLVRPMCAELGL